MRFEGVEFDEVEDLVKYRALTQKELQSAAQPKTSTKVELPN